MLSYEVDIKVTKKENTSIITVPVVASSADQAAAIAMEKVGIRTIFADLETMEIATVQQI
jgi:capsular polysaccharide biosynthesis protein